MGGGGDEGLHEGGDGGVDVQDGSMEVGTHADIFVGEEEGGSGGCKIMFECRFEGGEEGGGYGGGRVL